MKKKSILVVEDDAALNHLIAVSLRHEGFDVFSATHGHEALKLAYEVHPDLVILDIMMPEIDGWQTCKRLREMSDVPIIMLTAKVAEEDVIHGFGLGADDYIRKPFSLKELEMRVRAILRRAESEPTETPLVYRDDTLRIDLERQHVFRNGEVVRLTPTEFRLLSCLVQNQGYVVPHKKLLSEVWGPSYVDATASLSLYIRYLRQKLEVDPTDPSYIRTRWGVGYWFAPADGA